MIRVENLVKKYGSTLAVNGLNLSVNSGEIYALLGLNGAGKSTTIKILCGLVKKDEGRVIIGGFDQENQANEISKIINLSPQETAVASNLTVMENLVFIAKIYGVNDYNERAKSLIEKFELEQKINARAKTLSGGQKRKLSVAMALITNPKLLILDEPTLGLDIISRKELWKVIKSLKGSTTILLTTHYLEEAQSLADRIGVMKSGNLVAEGSADEIIKISGEDNFESAFIKLAGEGLYNE